MPTVLPFIPQRITVHLGPPGSNAQNVTVSFVDYVKNVVVEDRIDSGYYDGEYYWDETDIYHLEKYNMPINQEFIEYVLSK